MRYAGQEVLTEIIAEQIAWNLKRECAEQLRQYTELQHERAKNMEIAFLLADDRIWYTCNESRWPAPSSPVVGLIQGIWQEHPTHARRILRSRIFSTATPTEMCWGMVKVAAKRLTAPVSAIDHGIEIPQKTLELRFTPSATSPMEATPITEAWWEARSDEEFIQAAIRLSEQARREKERYASDRPIGAILVSPEGKLLEWAVNANARNRTLHAELILLQEHFRKTGAPIPAGSRIYTSLKPCKMCAAMIWHCAEDVTKLRVIYAEEDPGPMGKATVLDRGTFERQRASRNPEELGASVQFRLQPVSKDSTADKFLPPSSKPSP